ncbi:DNA damage-inducible protein D [Mannheimia glucosida]|uniref:DNA damage-inducible protein D n=1 Tax=Mannheimia glucosida TaxID=85401 RepID=UPI0039183A3A
MNKAEISLLKTQFDQYIQIIDGTSIEFFYARDVMSLLGYDKWDNFKNVLEKAKEACHNSDVPIDEHFRDVYTKSITGNNAERTRADMQLTRYACYLVAQNADPRKSAVAFAQTYFALQTRKQELLEERLALQNRLDARQKLTESETKLSQNIYERGVDEQGFGRIRSKGDAALFGGNSTQTMKEKLSVPKSRPLADFLPTVTIAAKNLATEITNFNVESNDLQGETSISEEHVQNNKSVREMLKQRGIKPEELPPAEDLQKLKRRVTSANKKLIKQSALPKKEDK